jgi:hypothetical protein
VETKTTDDQDQQEPTGNEGQPTFNEETRRRDTYVWREKESVGQATA